MIYAVLYDKNGKEIEKVDIYMTDETLQAYHTNKEINAQIQQAIRAYGERKWKDFDCYEIRKEGN